MPAPAHVQVTASESVKVVETIMVSFFAPTLYVKSKQNQHIGVWFGFDWELQLQAFLGTAPYCFNDVIISGVPNAVHIP